MTAVVGDGEGDRDPSDPLPVFTPGTLASGEVVLQKWATPGGQGILTNLRCLLLGNRDPVRRRIRWSQDLEKVRALVVVQLPADKTIWVGMRGSLAGGALSPGQFDSEFGVIVDRTMVYAGAPKVCADLQQRIDDARTSRCLALFQRVLPYNPLPPVDGA